MQRSQSFHRLAQKAQDKYGNTIAQWHQSRRDLISLGFLFYAEKSDLYQDAQVYFMGYKDSFQISIVFGSKERDCYVNQKSNTRKQNISF